MTEPEYTGMTIGALARSAGVGVETIRFYQRKGLVPEPPRPPGGIRRYSTAAQQRLQFIKSAQRLGFSLDEIRELLRLEDGTDCDEARLLAERKLADVRVRMAELQRMESALSGLVAECADAAGEVCCPLISALQQPNRRLRAPK